MQEQLQSSEEAKVSSQQLDQQEQQLAQHQQQLKDEEALLATRKLQLEVLILYQPCTVPETQIMNSP